MTIKIDSLTLSAPVVLAPMSGVTDLPFRRLVKSLGAGLVVSEMIASQAMIRQNKKSMKMATNCAEEFPMSVQLAGCDPGIMGEAAKLNEDRGAAIIDINMGCPAKKVCKVMAGSALLKDELLVSRILESVVKAVDVPVTLKIRTGWDKNNRNALNIARIASDSGIQALTIHGRTRACGFKGSVEHETAGEIKARYDITVIANGDITTPEMAKKIINDYGVDGIMIGRAAQGNPWIFREIDHYLRTGDKLALPTLEEIHKIVIYHVSQIHKFYGEKQGVRIARKHISWYCQKIKQNSLYKSINQIVTAKEQILALNNLFGSEKRFAA